LDIERAATLYEERKNVVEAFQRGEPVSIVAQTHGVCGQSSDGWRAILEAQKTTVIIKCT